MSYQSIYIRRGAGAKGTCAEDRFSAGQVAEGKKGVAIVAWLLESSKVEVPISAPKGNEIRYAVTATGILPETLPLVERTVP